MKFYQVKNWSKFQHYKHRNPPWIKLHQEILSSQDWVLLADASKLLAVVCMVIAAKHEGRVPNDPAYIKRVAYLDAAPNLKPLIECGFLIETLADASESKQQRTNADPETETETETETENSRVVVALKALPKTRGARLLETWEPSQEGRAFAEEKIGAEGANLELDKFRDYWTSMPGQKGLKLDWNKTWKNWVRNSNTGNYYGRVQKTGNSMVEAGRRLAKFAGQIADEQDAGRTTENAISPTGSDKVTRLLSQG